MKLVGVEAQEDNDLPSQHPKLDRLTREKVVGRIFSSISWLAVGK